MLEESFPWLSHAEDQVYNQELNLFGEIGMQIQSLSNNFNSVRIWHEQSQWNVLKLLKWEICLLETVFWFCSWFQPHSTKHSFVKQDFKGNGKEAAGPFLIESQGDQQDIVFQGIKSKNELLQETIKEII